MTKQERLKFIYKGVLPKLYKPFIFFEGVYFLNRFFTKDLPLYLMVSIQQRAKIILMIRVLLNSKYNSNDMLGEYGGPCHYITSFFHPFFPPKLTSSYKKTKIVPQKTKNRRRHHGGDYVSKNFKKNNKKSTKKKQKKMYRTCLGRGLSTKKQKKQGSLKYRFTGFKNRKIRFEDFEKKKKKSYGKSGFLKKKNSS